MSELLTFLRKPLFAQVFLSLLFISSRRRPVVRAHVSVKEARDIQFELVKKKHRFSTTRFAALGSGGTPSWPQHDAMVLCSNVDDDNQTVSAAASELVYVLVTVYYLNGLTVCEMEPRKKRGSSNAKKAKTGVGELLKAAPPPTTALVSASRYIHSSGFAIQTFLPSMELRASEPRRPGESRRCTARWQDDDEELTFFGAAEFLDEPSSSKMQLTRIMKREPFRPNMKIGNVPHFRHERIDLKIGVARGKEIVQLGEASIAVSGEEEEEIVTTIPVKRIRTKSGSRNLCAGFQKKWKGKGHFDDAPMTMYGLEENATVRIGTRVVAQSLMSNADQIGERLDLIQCATSVTEEHGPTIELNDDNSLLESVKKEETEDCRWFPSLKTPDSVSQLNGGFFCSAMKVCSGIGTDENKPSKLSTSEGSKMTTAKVQPMHVLSDVSESTFGTYDESE